MVYATTVTVAAFWGSDIYMIYIERCRLQSMALSRAACSTSVEPEEADFLGVDDMEEDE